VHSILIVDDDVSELDALSDVLECAGYSTTCAQNGKRARSIFCAAPLHRR
jgi:CheY-like chemotaxis protein